MVTTAPIVVVTVVVLVEPVEVTVVVGLVTVVVTLAFSAKSHVIRTRFGIDR